jgi:hypothetical protein
MYHRQPGPFFEAIVQIIAANLWGQKKFICGKEVNGMNKCAVFYQTCVGFCVGMLQ